MTAAPSRLGTKEHWDSVYQRETRTFKELGDEGEPWFGEDSAESMVEWVTENLSDRNCSIVDIGSGNGHLLFLLYEEGYRNLLGLDYSETSIELSKLIATEKKMDISWRLHDVIDDPVEEETYDLALDKGTYDAIGLCEETREGRPLSDYYPIRVAKCLKPGGIFLITSCNWTQEELIAAFCTDSTDLSYHSHIPRPAFEFGGHRGQTITTIAFQRRES